MFKSQKRFIAGAVCPRCNEMDKLLVYCEEGRDFRACVSCGFNEEMRFQNTSRELDTRVNRSAEERLQETSVVKVLDSGKKNVNGQ